MILLVLMNPKKGILGIDSLQKKEICCVSVKMMAFLILEYRFQNFLKQNRYEFKARDLKRENNLRRLIGNNK